MHREVFVIAGRSVPERVVPENGVGQRIFGWRGAGLEIRNQADAADAISQTRAVPEADENRIVKVEGEGKLAVECAACMALAAIKGWSGRGEMKNHDDSLP